MCAKWKYLIDRPEESKEYLRAWSITGRYLQNKFDEYNAAVSNPYEGFCWLRTQIISPTFDSMNFRYKNRVFSILVCPVTKKNGKFYTEISPKQRALQIEICNANDLIPCAFYLNTENWSPIGSGWNLRYTETGKNVDPVELSDDSPRRMSEWELMNWGISLVMDELRKDGKKILSFTDAPGVMPNLWFEDEIGHKNWVQVIVNKPMEMIDFEGTPAGKYSGYLAGLRILPVDGEKFLYRSHPANIEYNGLQSVR